MKEFKLNNDKDVHAISAEEVEDFVDKLSMIMSENVDIVREKNIHVGYFQLLVMSCFVYKFAHIIASDPANDDKDKDEAIDSVVDDVAALAKRMKNYYKPCTQN